ncbi:hypothetical protein [Clostridium boliviensis]|uniref:hypothetical protein n=1 Tax=Clostridium boliviensis TaxID=318465 RepID=UPI002963D40E|nr:hypothetical protein [Clostridium boliviensis]
MDIKNERSRSVVSDIPGIIGVVAVGITKGITIRHYEITLFVFCIVLYGSILYQ